MTETVSRLNPVVGPALAVPTVPVANATVATPQPAAVPQAVADNSAYQSFVDQLTKTLSATPGNENLVEKLKEAVPANTTNTSLTEEQVREMFTKRLDPSMESLAAKTEDIGKTVVGLLQSDIETEQKAQLVKTRESLVNNDILGSLVKRVGESLTAIADMFTGLAEQVQALYAKDKECVLNFATQWLHIMKETFKHGMSHDPFMKMAMIMSNLNGTQNLLPKADRKVANKAVNFPNN